MTLLRNSTIFGLANVDTFRRSSKKLFGIWGGNLQNTGKKGLTIYRPARDDHSFVQADQAGAEALVVAYLAPLGKFRKLFLAGIKSHTYVAAYIFADRWIKEGYPIASSMLDYEPSELKKNPEWKRLADHIKNNCDQEYFIGKKSCHSFNYRMAPPTFREDVLKESEGEVALSKQEAERLHTSYHGPLFPEISNGWWPEIEAIVRQTGYLYNLFGFPCYCQGPFTEKTWRELTAWVPQSTVGCITAIAVCAMQDFIEENGLEDRWHILNDKHDSYMVECPDEDVMICGQVMRETLAQRLVSPRGEEFFMRSEVGAGKTWAKWDAKKNPDGIKEISFAT